MVSASESTFRRKKESEPTRKSIAWLDAATAPHSGSGSGLSRSGYFRSWAGPSRRSQPSHHDADADDQEQRPRAGRARRNSESSMGRRRRRRRLHYKELHLVAGPGFPEGFFRHPLYNKAIANRAEIKEPV